MILRIGVSFLLIVVSFQLFGQTNWCNSIGQQITHSDARMNSVDNEPKKLALAIHIVYNTEEENVSTRIIEEQLKNLNADFNAKNIDIGDVDAGFFNVIGAANLTFGVASKSPDGNEAIGITRTATPVVRFFNNDIMSSQTGGADPWDPAQYINVWIGPLSDGILGWATLPNGSDPFGIVIDYRTLASGRTLTHEMGHLLGLQHLEGLVGGCNDDDGIVDTPLQESEISDCSLESISCGSKNMAQNFMNIGSDACSLFFTQGQTDAMRSNLQLNYPTISDQIVDVLVTNIVETNSIEAWYKIRQGSIIVDESQFRFPLVAQLYDLKGKEVKRITQFNTHEIAKIKITGLNGVYILKVSDADKSKSIKLYISRNYHKGGNLYN